MVTFTWDNLYTIVTDIINDNEAVNYDEVFY